MKILFLGHSLVAYYDWQARFPEHVVENCGIAGETAAGLLGRLDTIAAGSADPDAILVMTGTNDLLPGAEDAVDAIREIAGKLRRSYPGALVVLQSVLPVHPRWASPEELARLNVRIAGVASEESVAYFDLTGHFTDEWGTLRPELLLDDGVHLTDDGYRVWSKALEEWLFRI
jgi:lysophospholipase L1-like esterase